MHRSSVVRVQGSRVILDQCQGGFIKFSCSRKQAQGLQQTALNISRSSSASCSRLWALHGGCRTSPPLTHAKWRPPGHMLPEPSASRSDLLCTCRVRSLSPSLSLSLSLSLSVSLCAPKFLYCTMAHGLPPHHDSILYEYSSAAPWGSWG